MLLLEHLNRLWNRIRLVTPTYFSGPRGTGKTSVAKIFAKAMNCPNQEGGEPCNNCYICQAVTEGSLEDVIEMDAASNNGVDEIRDIREQINLCSEYSSVQGLYH